MKKLVAKSTLFLEPAGLKTGEVWLRFKTTKLTAWLVVDAFCGPKLQKSATEAKLPELLKTFPNYGVADKSKYASWSEKQVNRDSPTLLIPCHGNIIRSKTLPSALTALLKKISS